MLRPGVPLREIHGAMLEAVRRAGVPGYARGHFGHGLGNDPFSEQWPFISSDCPVVAEADMVLAVEAPFYVDGLGGFIVEDQVVVTADGHQLMTFADRRFRSF
jgi:Xaa-Pro aminopeptidase